MKRTLATLLLVTPAFGQDVAVEEEINGVSTPEGMVEEVEFHVVSQESVICPPQYDPMDCTTSVEVEPNIFYRTCESEVRGEEYVWVTDEAGNDRRVVDPYALRYTTTLEKWVDKSNEHVINVRFRLTVKRHASGWGLYNYSSRLNLCPYPYTHVQGNIYWDWKTAYEWYELNATPEDWLLYQEHNVNFGGMSWRTRRSFGSGGDIYFGCRKISGKLYDGPTPLFQSRDIEWDGKMWKSKFPAEPVDLPANIKLEPPCDFDPSIPESNDFAINLQVSMSGPMYISSSDGEMLPVTERIVIPNVLHIEGHAEFVVMDPVECQPVYEEDGGDSSYDEVVP